MGKKNIDAEIARLAEKYDKTVVSEKLGMSLSEIYFVIAIGLYGPFVPVNDSELFVPPFQNEGSTQRGFLVRLMILKIAASLAFSTDQFRDFQAELLDLDQGNPVLIKYVNLFVAQMNSRLGLIQSAINNWLHKNLFGPSGAVAPWRGKCISCHDHDVVVTSLKCCHDVVEVLVMMCL